MTGKIQWILLIAAVSTAGLLVTAEAENASDTCVPVYGYKIINNYPHDIGAFTEGLVYDNGTLYEGTGLDGKSTLRKVDLKTGKVLAEISLPDSFFGEGITVWKDRIIQLTWKSGTGLVYYKDNLSLADSFTYNTEGWGITSDGEHLIMSIGTDTLYILDPETFKAVGQIKVRYNSKPLSGLNELEYIKGMVYANIWPTDNIAVISPKNGAVKSWIDLKGLLSAKDRKNTDVLNGIAYDPEGDRLFVTGKLWPRLFEIKLTDGGNCSTS
ncbi:MAG: glutaminyl-peptide cyclotransferase [Methanotrichaceae archaeon]